MRFLISTNVPNFRSVLGDDVAQISFCQQHSRLASHINHIDKIDVWICEGNEVTQLLICMDQWAARNQDSPKTLLVRNVNLITRLEALSGGRMEIQITSNKQQFESSWELSTLRAGEMLYAGGCARGGGGGAVHHRNEEVVLGLSQDRATGKTVLVIGGGIMNLVAADYFATCGFQVRIVDAGPDPQTCKDWTRLGVTHGGCDARMFTFIEADNYNEKGSDIYHDMRHIFRKTAPNGGWSVKLPSNFSAAELAWVMQYFRTTPDVVSSGDERGYLRCQLGSRKAMGRVHGQRSRAL